MELICEKIKNVFNIVVRHTHNFQDEHDAADKKHESADLKGTRNVNDFNFGGFSLWF